MDTADHLEQLLEAHEREGDFSERLKIRNIMLGLVIPALDDFEAEPQAMQNVITRIADVVAAKNYRTTLYDFLRFQENPALKSSQATASISAKFNDEKIHMQAFAEGFLSDFDMNLSQWGKFVLERMREMRTNHINNDSDLDTNIISFPRRD